MADILQELFARIWNIVSKCNKFVDDYEIPATPTLKSALNLFSLSYIFRIGELSEGFLLSYNKSGIITAANHLRSLLENVANGLYIMDKIEKPLESIKIKISPDAEKLILNILCPKLFGSKRPEFLDPDMQETFDDGFVIEPTIYPKAIHVNDCLKFLGNDEREKCEVKYVYDCLCDIVHPNVGALYSYVAEISENGLNMLRRKNMFELRFSKLVLQTSCFPDIWMYTELLVNKIMHLPHSKEIIVT